MEEKFNLNIQTENGEVIIRHGEANDVFQYHGFRYELSSAESFVKGVKAKGDPKTSVITYSDKNVVAVTDCTVTDRTQDKIVYAFQKSEQFKEWNSIFGLSLTQKEMLDLLRIHEHEIEDYEKLLIAVRNFKYVTQTEGDFTRTDDDNYVMSIKVKEAEGTLKMPRFIFVNMVILNESQFTQKVEVQLDIIKPKGEGDKLSFKLSCPIMNRYVKDAIKSETDLIKSELTNYLLLAGTQE